MEIEDLIKQDIVCKKLLLSYCIEEMRDNLNKLKDRDKTLLDFYNARQKIIVEYGFKNRIGTARENITYLVNKKKICDRFKSEFINNIGDLEHEIIELVKEIGDEFDAFRRKFVCGNADIEYYVNNIKNKYMNLIRTYKDFLIEEGKIKEEVIKIWMDELKKDELKKDESYIENDKFKLLVYATEKDAESVVKDVLCDNGVIHTSYITDTHPYVHKNREYGLIFDINKETLLYMCKRDAQTADFDINKETLLYMYKGDAQKADFKGSIDYIFSMNDFHCFRKKGILRVHNSGIDLCSTYLPEQLSETYNEYNEVVLINNKYNMPKAVFVFDDAKEIWKNHAEKLKEKLGLRLITIKRNKDNINL